MYNVLDIAKYVINYYQKQHIWISNLKLQKVLYFIQAEFLVSKGTPCFSENIEAWDFGPVIPEVYHTYKIYGGTGIPCKYDYIIHLSKENKEIINEMLEELKRYSPSYLTNLTHNQSPWKNNYVSGKYNIIPIDDIKNYFKEE